MTPQRNYWLAIANDVNSAILSRMGFPFYAMSHHGGKSVAGVIQVGDRCALYRAGGQKGFIGIFEVTEPTQQMPISLGIRRFPLRLPWRALVLSEDAPVDMKRLAPDLAFIRNKEHYGQYLQTNLRRLTESDFKVIERAFDHVVKGTAERSVDRVKSRI